MTLQNNSYQTLIKSYTAWLSIIGYSWQAVKYYPMALQELCSWLEDHNYNNIDQITATIIKEYYEYLKTRPNKSRSGALSSYSLNRHICALKTFNKYLKSHNQKAIPIHLETEKTDPIAPLRIVSQQEIKSMFDATEHSHKEPHIRLRDKAILVILYSCGLRVNEAVHLNTEDILFDAQRIYVKKGKNYKERFVPINNYNLYILTDYIYEARPLFNNSSLTTSLFVSYLGKRLQGQSLCNRIKAIIKATNDTALIERNITPHKLRHSIATHLLQQKAAIKDISKFLGHHSLESTQIYTHIL